MSSSLIKKCQLKLSEVSDLNFSSKYVLKIAFVKEIYHQNRLAVWGTTGLNGLKSSHTCSPVSR